MAYIIVDDREDNGAMPYMSCAVENNNALFERKNTKYGLKAGEIKYSIERCTIGDYIISIESEIPGHYITSLVIERKTWKDLAISLKDGRINSQSAEMLKYQRETGAKVLYIIEGKNVFYNRNTKISNIPFNNLHSYLRQSTIRDIPYIHTQSQLDTANILCELARDCLKLYRKGTLKFPLQMPRDDYEEVANIKEQLYPMLQDIECEWLKRDLTKLYHKLDMYSMEWDKTEILDRRLTKPITTNNKDIEINMWKTFPDIGAATAQVIAGELDIRKLGTFAPCDLENLIFESGKSISNKVIKNIVNNQNKKEQHIKIISQIPQISKDFAEFLFTKITPMELMTLEFNVPEILEMKYKGKRTKAKVKKILSFIHPEEDFDKVMLDRSHALYKSLLPYGDPDEIFNDISDIMIFGDRIEFKYTGEQNIFESGKNKIDKIL